MKINTPRRLVLKSAVALSSTWLSACGGGGAGGGNGGGGGSTTAPVTSTSLITPSFASNRISGVAPLYVHLDATATTAPSLTSSPIHDLAYKWTFGDTSAGVWAHGALAHFGYTSSKNIDYGPTAAHVFETPGTYTVTLNTWHGDIDGPPVTVTITVDDPDTVFAGANTICIARGALPVAGVNGVPPGATCVNSASGDAAAAWATHNADGKRILWRRGDTFDVSTPMVVDKNGPGLIGAYGAGANPIFSLVGGLSVWEVKSVVAAPKSDWRLVDMQLMGNSISGSNGVVFTSDFNQVTCVRLVAENCTFGFKSSPSNLNTNSTLWDAHCYYNCNVVGGQGALGGNGYYIAGTRNALIGANIDTNELGEHGARMASAHKAVIAHNTIKRIASGRAHLTIRSGGLYGETSPNFNLPFVEDGYTTTKHLVMRDNYAESYAGRPTAIGVGPLNNNGVGRHRDAIIECNYTDHGTVTGQGINISIRSNICNTTSGITVFTEGFLDHQTPAYLNVMCYHNSTYSSSTQYETIFYQPTGTDCVGSSIAIYNNLAYGPNATNDYYAGTGLVSANGQTITITQDGNTTWGQVKTTNPYPVSTPSTPAQMKPAAASYALTGASEVPVWYDFLNTRIQPSISARTKGAIHR